MLILQHLPSMPSCLSPSLPPPPHTHTQVKPSSVISSNCAPKFGVNKAKHLRVPVSMYEGASCMMQAMVVRIARSES